MTSPVPRRASWPPHVAMLLKLALCPVLSTHAYAQATAAAPRPSWSGPYIGLDFGGRFIGSDRASGMISPYRYPGFAAPTAPPTSRYGVLTDLGAAPIGAIRGGYLFDFDRFVLGVEGEVEGGGASGSGTMSASYDGGSLNVCGAGSAGCLSGPATDSIAVRTSLDWGGSLRARIGVPLGDRTLLSVFGGPAFLAASVRASQASSATSLYLYFSGSHFFPSTAPLGGVATASRAQTLVGGTLGGAIDYRIDAHWILRGEYAVSIYPSLTVRLPEGAGTASSATFDPTLHMLRLGVAYRF